MTMKDGWELLGGAIWPDDPTEAGLPPLGEGVGYTPQLQADRTMKLLPPAAATGHWKPLANGNPDDPKYLFSNGNGLETWVED